MVRFIIMNWLLSIVSSTIIYIPIWLDLLLLHIDCLPLLNLHLHSNMVRFIICEFFLSFLILHNLHSNMVRFIIADTEGTKQNLNKFTFQYGQIYYLALVVSLDLNPPDLHSNMVRFIINQLVFLLPLRLQIYIPIWLDLLQSLIYRLVSILVNLHSNMVRFIIF